MKDFISKVRNLSQKAAEIKAAMQQLPPKVAEIREAVAATTGQLQQLKSEIHFTVADLKADNEDRLSEAMQEINASAEVFDKAGFTLSRVDLEISPVQRMLVYLTKIEDVHSSMLRSLISANQHRRTTHAILSSLLQANQMADTVELGDLVYDEVIVGVGPIPSVRLCWRAEDVMAVPTVQPTPAIPFPASPPAPVAEPQSAFGQSSFFEKRASPSVPAIITPVHTSLVSGAMEQPARSMPTPASTPATGESLDPLARFKKMPDLTAHRK